MEFVLDVGDIKQTPSIMNCLKGFLTEQEGLSGFAWSVIGLSKKKSPKKRS